MWQVSNEVASIDGDIAQVHKVLERFLGNREDVDVLPGSQGHAHAATATGHVPCAARGARGHIYGVQRGDVEARLSKVELQ